MYPEVHSTIFSYIKDINQRCGIEVNVSDWHFISLKHINLQNNGYDCGIYACINAYSMMKNDIFNIENDLDCYNIRYWICNTIRNKQREKNTYKNNKLKSTIVVDPDIITTKMISTSTDIFEENCHAAASIHDDELMKYLQNEAIDQCSKKPKRTIKKATKCYRASCAAEEIDQKIGVDKKEIDKMKGTDSEEDGKNEDDKESTKKMLRKKKETRKNLLKDPNKEEENSENEDERVSEEREEGSADKNKHDGMGFTFIYFLWRNQVISLGS